MLSKQEPNFISTFLDPLDFSRSKYRTDNVNCLRIFFSCIYFEAFKSKWANSSYVLYGFNLLRLGGLHLSLGLLNEIDVRF